MLEEIFLGGWRWYICAPNWKSREEGVLYDNNSLCGGGMDIFWKHIYTLNFHTIQIYYD